MLCFVVADGKLEGIYTEDIDAQQACFKAVKKNDAKSAEVHRVSTVPSFRWTADQQAHVDRLAKEQAPESQR